MFYVKAMTAANVNNAAIVIAPVIARTLTRTFAAKNVAIAHAKNSAVNATLGSRLVKIARAFATTLYLTPTKGPAPWRICM